MLKIRKSISAFLFFLCFSTAVQADYDDSQLAVWANEALVSTYTFNAENFIDRQKEIAHYFTAEGWTAFSKAQTAAGLPADVLKNNYAVSAVATAPPQISLLRPNHWRATMPLLVVYKNPQYQQRQNLQITIDFVPADKGQGVRGLAITDLQAKESSPACRCKGE